MSNNLQTYLTIALVLLLIPFQSFSQASDSTSTRKLPKINRSAYIGASVGIGYSSFRDFATSPLVYKGAPKYVGLSFIRMNKFRETEIRVSGILGSYGISVGNEQAISSASFFNIYYSRLFRWNKISNDKWNFKYGGLYKFTGDIRTNTRFQNNAVGMEFFSTVFASFKVTHDLSRTTTKEKRFLWIKHTVHPRKREFSFHFNLGILNANFRNGYAYAAQGSAINKPALFDGYEMHLNGFRMSSQLDYTIHMKNKNAIQFSYIWDAAKTGGDLDVFEVAHHVFKVSLLFNTNNK